SMMNLNASHDSPRFWTSMSNTNKYKFQAKNTDYAGYYTGLPSEDAFARGKALLLHQFTFIGSPHVWNGDEMGMWGSDDPDNRKPLWWPEMDMVEETNSPYASYTYKQKPQFDKGLHQYYKDLIALRKSNIVLSEGAIDFVAEYVSQGALAYIRNIEEDDVLILINPSAEKISVNLKETDRQRKIQFELGEHTLEGENINLQPFSGVVMTKD
ncbi:MAG: alpha-amylase family glycosyl hydrolase, partial [Saprospiraceae bacterium]